MNKPKCVWLLSVSVLLLTACGGGAGTASLSGIEGSGTGQPQPVPVRITSAGEVTAKGSIFVNDVEYALNGTSIAIDGAPASEADLDVGGIVIVEGELDENRETGKATRVTAGIAVAGPISAIDRALQHFTILGQTVVVDAQTRIVRDDAKPVSELDIGDDVEVTGFADSTGAMFARRIVPRRASTPLRMTGYAQQVDIARHHFVINGQTVDYTSATLTNVSESGLSGASVRVDADDVDGQGRMLATRVVYRDPRLPGKATDLAELQGWVTRFASRADFDVDGHPVVTTSRTTIETGLKKLSQIQLDSFVHVSGRIIANGVVEAATIETNNVISLETTITGLDERHVHANFVPWAGTACQVTDQTAISVDGVPAKKSDLNLGDVATIYLHHLPPFEDESGEVRFDARCQIIAVDHAIVGPLDIVPADKPWIVVMGQRVWLQQPQLAVDLARIGDIVSVSGNLTAAGDLLASRVDAAAHGSAFRLTGIVRSIRGGAMQIGELTVDFSQAQMGGFVNGAPRVGDRVTVIADTEPVAGGPLDATVVRFAAGMPRGAINNVVTLNGLLTAVGPPGILAVEGRAAHDLHTGYELGTLCDPAKLRPDLKIGLVTFGATDGLGYLPPVCPFYGRGYDETESRLGGHIGGAGDGWVGLQVQGPVTDVDPEERVLEVAGVRFHAIPGALLTRNRWSGTTAPVNLGDISIGEKAQVETSGIPFRNGVRPIGEAWFGDVRAPEGEFFSLLSRFESASSGELVTYSGLHIAVDSGVEIRVCDAKSQRYLEWLTSNVHPEVLVGGRVEAGRMIAEHAYWFDCPAFVDAGPDQTVAAGTQVVLQGATTEGSEHPFAGPLPRWSQVSGPVAINFSTSGEHAEFVAPSVTTEVTLVFELEARFTGEYCDGPCVDYSLHDAVTIHVLPQ